jgi:CheY-like chemotaxis protein
MPSGRILIVDDNASIRHVMRTLLESSTALEICGEAVDGVDAIEKAKQLNPDLILLDLSMPRMNGAEVASVLKRSMPDVPIILFTAFDEDVGKSLAAALGVDLVLPKIEMTALADHAQALLAQRRNDKSFGTAAS